MRHVRREVGSRAALAEHERIVARLGENDAPSTLSALNWFGTWSRSVTATAVFAVLPKSASAMVAGAWQLNFASAAARAPSTTAIVPAVLARQIGHRDLVASRRIRWIASSTREPVASAATVARPPPPACPRSRSPAPPVSPPCAPYRHLRIRRTTTNAKPATYLRPENTQSAGSIAANTLTPAELRVA
jgi:hypothetical protein